MEIPRIIFSDWTPWEERSSLSFDLLSGVYVLAHFDEISKGPADPSAKEIVYVGESCASFKDRLNQFKYAAFSGTGAHSGGSTYRSNYRDENVKLWIAAFAVSGIPEKIRPSFILYVERKLIWEYAKRWGAQPSCNTK